MEIKEYSLQGIHTSRGKVEDVIKILYEYLPKYIIKIKVYCEYYEGGSNKWEDIVKTEKDIYYHCGSYDGFWCCNCDLLLNFELIERN